MELAAAVVNDHVAQDRDATGLGVHLNGRGVDAARPRHGRRGPELRGPEPRSALLDQRLVAERGAGEIAERDRSGRGTDHEGPAVLEADVLDGALKQARRHAAGPALHGSRGLHDRVAGVDGNPARAGSVAVRDKRGVPATHAYVAETGAEVFGADLGKHRLVALP